MNGQTASLEIVRSIIEKCEIEQVIETGTYRGTTTEWFSQFGVPVLSAEINPRYASFAQRRMASRPNVHIECMDSLLALKNWSKVPEVVSRRTLFYLDAHWQQHLPLSHELQLIDHKFHSWIVVIDDFKVPSDSDYGFDDYGPGQVLDLEYINRCNIRKIIAFFPIVTGKWETGRRRGCIVLAGCRDLAIKCSQISLLRPAMEDEVTSYVHEATHGRR